MLKLKFLLSLNLFLFSSIFLNAQFDIVWMNPSGVIIDGNSVTKNAGWTQDGSASSQNTLSAGSDGWVEFEFPNTNSYRYAGLATTNTTDYNSIDFAIYAINSSRIYIVENGANRGLQTTYTISDKFKIERVGSTISYKKNDVTFYSSSISSTSALTLNVDILSNGSSVSNATASFCATSNTPGATCDDGDPNTQNDTIQGDGCTCAGTTAGASVFEDDDTSGDGAVRYSGGKVIIGSEGTNKPGDYKLYVEGGVMTELCRISIRNSSSWADYVFAEDYDLKEIEEVAQFIQINNHLPNVPSAKVVATEGIDVAEMDATLLRQIEELWLHMIELKKENDLLKKEVEALKQ